MKKRTIEPGDIYRIGNHRVACGDCRDKEFVSKVFGKNLVSLILTDVPYAVSYVESKAALVGKKMPHAPILNDHFQSDEEFASFTHAWLEAVRPHLERKNAAYSFCSDLKLFAFRDGMTAAGWRFGQLLHWIKHTSVLGRLDFNMQHETILYFWLGTHEFQRSKDRSVLLHPKPSKNTLHPTCKPTGLLRRLILNSSRMRDLVYDPFAGSGSTAVAAEETGRRSVMIELDPRYCTVCLERLERCTGEKAVLLSPSRHGR